MQWISSFFFMIVVTIEMSLYLGVDSRFNKNHGPHTLTGGSPPDFAIIINILILILVLILVLIIRRSSNETCTFSII